jgi:Na+-translocating ferredoxin:NAD+ oxidoreductase RnfC subunit
MDIIQKIRQAGIVGAGGAGFPTYFKLSSAKGKVDTYIINAAECEPLIQVDKQILNFYTEQVFTAAEEVGNFLGVKKIVLGIKRKYHQTIEIIKNVLPKFDHRIEIYYLDNFYPAGDEFVLVYEVTKRIIPEAGLPLDVGVVVNNVVTLLNIYNALFENKPVLTRPISVLGEVKKPKTIIVPIGTLIKDVISFCGGTKITDYVVIDGGPMMGKIVSSEDAVTKRTSAILVLPEDHPIVRMKTLPKHYFLYQTKSACEQCRDCTEICPRYLLGHNFECHRIQRNVNYNIDTELLSEAFLCSECSLCIWVCPMLLLPTKVNQMVKQMLAEKGIKYVRKGKPENVHSMREYRKVPPERIIARFDLQKYVDPAEIELDTKEVNFLKIPMVQHIGVPAKPVVKKDDFVNKGQLIADVEETKLGVPIHSPVDGKVVEITDKYVCIEKK